MGELLTAQISTDGPKGEVIPPNVIQTEGKNGEILSRPGVIPSTPVAKAEDRPKWLPEKFKSGDDLAKAYTELEKKLSGAAPDAKDIPKPKLEAPEAQPKLDMAALSKEFADNNGKLTKETEEALAARGITKGDIEQFAKGQKALAKAQRDDLAAQVGGLENLTVLLEWAKTGLSDGEKDAYNKMLSDQNTDGAKALLRQFAAKYTEEYGSDGKRVVGATAAGNAGGITPFRSNTEVTTAMRDPRYATDSAYRADVEARLAISELFGK